MLDWMMANTLYVQVRKNVLRIRHIEGNKEREFIPPTPFTTSRLLVGQFAAADALLRKAIKDMLSGRGIFLVSPIMVMHPVEMVEGGLSEVEERVFIELAKGAGARKVFLHVGRPLSDTEVVAYGVNKH